MKSIAKITTVFGLALTLSIASFSNAFAKHHDKKEEKHHEKHEAKHETKEGEASK